MVLWKSARSRPNVGVSANRKRHGGGTSSASRLDVDRGGGIHRRDDVEIFAAPGDAAHPRQVQHQRVDVDQQRSSRASRRPAAPPDPAAGSHSRPRRLRSHTSRLPTRDGPHSQTNRHPIRLTGECFRDSYGHRLLARISAQRPPRSSSANCTRMPHLVELPAAGCGCRHDRSGRCPARRHRDRHRASRIPRRPQGRRGDQAGDSLLREDIDALEEAWEKAGAGLEGRIIKVQAPGPITLAAQLELGGGHRAITDPRGPRPDGIPGRGRGGACHGGGPPARARQWWCNSTNRCYPLLWPAGSPA